MSKYKIQDDHEWADEKQDERDGDQRPPVAVNTHSVVIDRNVDEVYIQKYRYRFAIEGGSVVGWTRSDIEWNGTEDYCSEKTWETIPELVKRALANELGLTVGEMDEQADLPGFLVEGDE